MWQSDDGAFSQDVALAESGGFGLRNNVNRSLIVITEGNTHCICVPHGPCSCSLCGLESQESRG